MKAIVANDKITIEDPIAGLEEHLTEALSYVDKAKQYQLRRMAKNSFLRSSPLYKQLQQEMSGCLLDNVNGKLIMSSCFLHLIGNINIEDRRTDTGMKVALPWIKKPYDLRDYQSEAVSLMQNNYRGIINFATGLGKTLVATHAIKLCRKRALVICPSESIANQFYKELVNAFGQNKVGFYGDGKKKLNDITVGIAASVNKHIDVFAKHNLGLIIMDEVHHVPANTFYSIASGLAHVGKIFGLSATDFRSDGKDIMITAGCGDVLIRRDIKWGVENGWLAEPYFIVRRVDTSKQRDYKGDKGKNYKSHVLNCDLMKNRIRSDIESFIKSGKTVLCLVDEVAHGVELSKQLGIPFATGKDKQSQEYVDQFNAGTIKGLIGTDGKIGEGSDTRPVEVLVMANFVASKGPVIQCIGRGLRKQGSKTHCIILDYIPEGSDMLQRHAFGRIAFYRDITDKVKLV